MLAARARPATPEAGVLPNFGSRVESRYTGARSNLKEVTPLRCVTAVQNLEGIVITHRAG